jgi:uncharacterized protein YdgA (DUF945 family)
MKRWLVALLVTLAVIVLVSPGIIGRIAEQKVGENLEFAASESDEIVVTTESFERGWFISAGRHRVALRDGPLRDLLESRGAVEIPSLLIETRVDHGLVPLASVGREAGSLMPGLASTISTVTVDAGGDSEFEVPGRIFSQVGLTGEMTSRFLMERGSTKIDEATLEWQGADVTVRSNPVSGSVTYDGEVQPFSFLDQLGGVRFGKIALAGDHAQTAYGLKVGSGEFELESLTIDSAVNNDISMGPFIVDGRNELEGERVNGQVRLKAAGIPAPAFGEMDFAIAVDFDGLHAQALSKIARVLRDPVSTGDPQSVLTNLYPQMDSSVQDLLGAGFEIRIDQFDVTFPDGELTSKMQFALPDASPDADFSWPSVILALDASVEIRLPVEIFEMLQVANPDAGALVGMGFLKQDGDFYEMHAEYAQGLITVNGAPLPIPLDF